MLLWPDVIAVSRIVAAEVSRFPELGTSFLAAAAAPLEEALVEYLEQANATGRLRIPDPALTAHLFLDTLRGGFFYRRLMGQETAPEELARSIDELVAMVVARGNA